MDLANTNPLANQFDGVTKQEKLVGQEFEKTKFATGINVKLFDEKKAQEIMQSLNFIQMNKNPATKNTVKIGDVSSESSFDFAAAVPALCAFLLNLEFKDKSSDPLEDRNQDEESTFFDQELSLLKLDESTTLDKEELRASFSQQFEDLKKSIDQTVKSDPEKGYKGILESDEILENITEGKKELFKRLLIKTYAKEIYSERISSFALAGDLSDQLRMFLGSIDSVEMKEDQKLLKQFGKKSDQKTLLEFFILLKDLGLSFCRQNQSIFIRKDLSDNSLLREFFLGDMIQICKKLQNLDKES